jgi:hypothetical protein
VVEMVCRIGCRRIVIVAPRAVLDQSVVRVADPALRGRWAGMALSVCRLV